MNSKYHEIPPIASRPSSLIPGPTPVTALAFDPLSDILWTGSNNASITAYYGSRGVRGVVFPVGGNLAVRDIIATDSNVRAYGISSGGIGAWSRGGINKWFYRTEHAVTAFSNNAANAPIFYAATAAQQLLAINSQTGDVVREAMSPSIYNFLADTHSALVSGSSDGYVRLHDPRAMQTTTHSVRAHHGGIQGLEAAGNYVFTIGMGTRQSRPFIDPLVKVYDIRTLRPLPPVPFPNGPAFVNRLPNKTTVIAITSNEGLINVVDVSNPADSEFHQLPTTSYVTSTAISPTGTYMAFGDADGIIHLLSATEEGTDLPLNGFEGQPVQWADPPEPYPEVEWTDSTPLNIIGMPYYNSLLLSSWTSKFLPTSALAPPPPKIPQQILDTMKYKHNIAYATMPKELRGRRNVVTTGPRKSGGRFRSGKTFRHESEPDTPTYEYDPEQIPKMYRRVEIEYSKFGVEDFDFGYFNHTEYSGLETHIENSYTNPLVQLLHYTLPIRQLAKSHITTDCPRENCLFCELGFVARMLEDARGTNCQSSNFCKTLGFLAQSSNIIELIDYGRESANLNYSHMIQSCHRFLVDCLSQEGKSFPNNPVIRPFSSGKPPGSPIPPPLSQIMGCEITSTVTCTNCGTSRDKAYTSHVAELVYPMKPIYNEPTEGTDFASILRMSLLRQTTHKAACRSCGKYNAIFETRRSIANQDLPPILAVNASVFSEETHKYWKDSKNKTLLSPTIELRGQVHGQDEYDTVRYELRGIVVQVVAKEKPSHLVALIKVPEAEYAPHSADDSHWYLFNDFSVRNVSEAEALSFPGSWKVPSILYFERVDMRSRLDFGGLPKEISPAILCQDTNISLNRDPRFVKHECLAPEELPRPGTLVAIDAEFVLMQQEETEYRSDGTKKVIRPARLSLARVSVLRGDGPKEGVPFIDDHIHTSEIIVDYLTEFSGIKYGDLDPQSSPYTLTPLKVVYKKLRLLVDKGCVFIGHGLSKDFRIINIFVPPDQVIDTVDLYYLRNRQRRLSLRFLAWFILKENIQTDTHDSIEDALSALRLYKAYQELESEGRFDKKLEELYKEGRQYNFKPPQAQGSPPSQPATAATPQFPSMQAIMTFAPTPHMAGGGMSHPFYAPSPSPFMQQNWRGQ
ncbi:hypothetical protein K474DRAFT_1659644 [Panus rudis PR-1116 ss-1]|nr:hypothetical protein K474DRAFT_1659644 [Panus rudis PR-1116 ss-1]